MKSKRESIRNRLKMVYKPDGLQKHFGTILQPNPPARITSRFVAIQLALSESFSLFERIVRKGAISAAGIDALPTPAS